MSFYYLEKECLTSTVVRPFLTFFFYCLVFLTFMININQTHLIEILEDRIKFCFADNDKIQHSEVYV